MCVKYVFSHLRFISESLSTFPTCDFQKSFVFKYNMFPSSIAGQKHLSTLLTLKVFHHPMNSHMSGETAIVGKASVTHLAFIFLDSSMEKHVSVQVRFTTEQQTTLYTLEILYTSMAKDVDLEGTLSGENLMAAITFKLA